LFAHVQIFNTVKSNCANILACLQIWFTKVEEKPKVFADDAIQCDECGSIRIVKYGFDCGKQTYYCKECHKKFREHSILRKVKFTPELITLCLNLYFFGLSLKDFKKH
jgi:transposase-like protein